jgi:hypothetical protein
MSGLLFAGLVVELPGVTVIGQHDAEWAHLDPGDGHPRWRMPDKVILHRTMGDVPERILPGRGPKGHTRRTAEYWQRKKADGTEEAHSGAHLVIDGWEVACLADLIQFCAWHGNQANERSIGIEHCEEVVDGQPGAMYQGTLDNAAPVYLAIAEHCGIQIQHPKPESYHGPLTRFRDGGSTLIGFFGHCHVTNQRSEWDPGLAVFDEVLDKQCNSLAFDFERGEDLAFWKDIQADLNRRGHKLVVDGLPGKATTEALRLEGYRSGIYALGKAREPHALVPPDHGARLASRLHVRRVAEDLEGQASAAIDRRP